MTITHFLDILSPALRTSAHRMQVTFFSLVLSQTHFLENLTYQLDKAHNVQMYSTYFSTKMLVAKLAQMGNFCLAKFNAMWPMAQMAFGSTSLE